MADAQSRPSFFDLDVAKMMSDFRFRPFDVDALMACQRRNIEALTQASQLTMEAARRSRGARSKSPVRPSKICRRCCATSCSLVRPRTGLPRTPNTPSRYSRKASATAAKSPCWRPRPAPKQPMFCTGGLAKGSTRSATSRSTKGHIDIVRIASLCEPAWRWKTFHSIAADERVRADRLAATSRGSRHRHDCAPRRGRWSGPARPLQSTDCVRDRVG